MLALSVVALVLGIPHTGFNKTNNRPAAAVAPAPATWQPHAMRVASHPEADLKAELTKLRASDAEAARALEQDLDDAHGYLGMGPDVVVVVGRIVAPAGQSPRSVTAQFVPNEQGYFVTPLHDWRQPFDVSGTGIVWTHVQLDPPPGRVVWIGDVVLEAASQSERAPVHGIVRTEVSAQSTVALEGSIDFINTAHHGTQGTCPERTIEVPVGADGTWSASLPPGRYLIVLDAPGHVSQYREFMVTTPGLAVRVQDVMLERPKAIDITWIGSKTGQFAGVTPAHRALAADDEFKMFPEADGNELEVAQKNGKLSFHTRYGPSTLVDLGAGTLDQFRNVNVQSTGGTQDFSSVPLVAGHVYLLKPYFEAWALFRVDKVP
jgi:hypothetical protein